MRAALLFFGVLTLMAVWLGPLPSLAPGSFSAHMTMHMGVVAVAAPALALGVAGGRFDPVRHAPQWFPPVPASIVELVVVWGFHTPTLHALARGPTAGLVLEQGSFLASGLVVWLAAFGGDVGQRSERTAAGIVALLLTSMHMTLLGALLALPTRLLYSHSAHHAGHALGSLGPLQDQQLGGAIMLVVGGVSYLFGGLWLTGRLLRDKAPRRRPATRWPGPPTKARPPV
jgi:putative membrane protein